MKHDIEDQLQKSQRKAVRMTTGQRQVLFQRVMESATDTKKQVVATSRFDWLMKRPALPISVAVCGALLVMSISIFSYNKTEQLAHQDTSQQITNQIESPSLSTNELPKVEQPSASIALERKREAGYEGYVTHLFGSGGALEMNTRQWKISDFTPSKQEARNLPVFQLHESSVDALKARAQIFSVSDIKPVKSDIISGPLFSNFTPSLASSPTTSQDPLNCTLYNTQSKDRCLVVSPKGFVYFSQTAAVAEQDGESQAKRFIAAVYNTTADAITTKKNLVHSENAPTDATEILLYPPDYTIAGVTSAPQPWSALLIDGKLVTLVGFVIEPDIEHPVDHVDILSAQDAYTQFSTEWATGAFDFEQVPHTFIYENPFTQLTTLPQGALELNGSDFILQYEVLRQKSRSENMEIWVKPVYRFIGDVKDQSFDFDIIVNSTGRKDFLQRAYYFYTGN